MKALMSAKRLALDMTSILGLFSPNWAAAARATACAVTPTESLITWMVGMGLVMLSCTIAL